MSITDLKIQKALKIQNVVSEYFEKTDNSIVLAKDLMNLFISNGIFSKDNKNGRPIRDLLRDLYAEDLLHLIPLVIYKQKKKNKNWYFVNPKTHST